jgi:predicted regulator of amino acid metabolism with ACT domain
MISDVLFDAKEDIERYLNDPVYSDVYTDENLRNRLNDLIAKMEEIRIALDTPPDITNIKERFKRVFADLKTEIEERCKIAGIECNSVKVHNGNESNEAIAVSLWEGGNKRQIIISTAEEANNLLKFPFQNYLFLSGYEAICSYNESYIEAILSPLEETSMYAIIGCIFGIGNIDFVWELDKLNSQVEVNHDLPGGSIITISISPLSEQARVLLRDTLDIGISLKITGLKISRQDEAVRYLKDYANSIFFQIDLTREVPLALKRTQYQKQTILSQYPQTPVEIEYPKCKYDEEALSLYWYARSANRMPPLQYLAYYQIIEFYFPVYSQLKAKNTIQNILKTPGFNVHNDTDIIKLLNIAKSGLGQGAGSERKQLEATLQECLNISSLRIFLENNEKTKDFLTRKKTDLDLEKLAINEGDDGLRKSVVNRIYEVRCRIVHTKTESDFEKAKSIYPFTQEANLLKHDIRLIHYIAKQILIASSREFKH